MIQIKKSPTAGARTCDFSKVTKDELLKSSIQHISDVSCGMEFFARALVEAAKRHDHDKISDIDGFHRDFATGFQKSAWWVNHQRINRHHGLQYANGGPDDVNLVDVLEMIVDCVMAGMARAGTVRAVEISPELLMQAFQNTVELLKLQVQVIE